MIEVEGLTVHFGGVTPLDDMTVSFEKGTCGLIGPNGAGKTTFFNVLSGFVKPAAGSITVFGENLLRMADYRRARWGLRRTFQQEQAIAKLSVFENVAMIHEHSGGGRSSRQADVLDALTFVGSSRWPGRRSESWGQVPAVSWSSPGPSSATLAWCSWTSRQRVFRTSKPSISAR